MRITLKELSIPALPLSIASIASFIPLCTLSPKPPSSGLFWWPTAREVMYPVYTFSLSSLFLLNSPLSRVNSRTFSSPAVFVMILTLSPRKNPAFFAPTPNLDIMDLPLLGLIPCSRWPNAYLAKSLIFPLVMPQPLSLSKRRHSIHAC